MSLKIFILSPLERTLALRQGFQPLSDYRFNVKLTPMGIAVSLQMIGYNLSDINSGCTGIDINSVPLLFCFGMDES